MNGELFLEVMQYPGGYTQVLGGYGPVPAGYTTISRREKIAKQYLVQMSTAK